MILTLSKLLISGKTLKGEIVMKKTFYLLKEEKGRKEMGFVAEYELLKEAPSEIKDDWECSEIEVNILDEMSIFGIKDKDCAGNYFGNISINSDLESLNRVVRAVGSIDGYNDEMLFDLIWFAFEGQVMPTPDEYVYF